MKIFAILTVVCVPSQNWPLATSQPHFLDGTWLQDSSLLPPCFLPSVLNANQVQHYRNSPEVVSDTFTCHSTAVSIRRRYTLPEEEFLRTPFHYLQRGMTTVLPFRPPRPCLVRIYWYIDLLCCCICLPTPLSLIVLSPRVTGVLSESSRSGKNKPPVFSLRIWNRPSLVRIKRNITRGSDYEDGTGLVTTTTACSEVIARYPNQWIRVEWFMATNDEKTYQYLILYFLSGESKCAWLWVAQRQKKKRDTDNH